MFQRNRSILKLSYIFNNDSASFFHSGTRGGIGFGSRPHFWLVFTKMLTALVYHFKHTHFFQIQHLIVQGQFYWKSSPFTYNIRGRGRGCPFILILISILILILILVLILILILILVLILTWLLILIILILILSLILI